ncbi:hypothetical protein DY000_02011365 [Brassica cretica]|uniref:Uncharacterized protein n=1 Tax=Brassica cretica TaxID=69181 RepID=A0ABQ7CRY9_BRACR|nr:hypothetical protein DY000_02011365 [Brassica cretica]
MANSRVFFFSDSKSGRCSSVVEARLLRYWEADPVFEVHGTYRLRWACGNERADPMERFWFCNCNHLMLFAKTNTDFVGDVRGIKTIYNAEIQSTLRLMTITRRHSTVCLSVFYGIAAQKDS